MASKIPSRYPGCTISGNGLGGSQYAHRTGSSRGRCNRLCLGETRLRMCAHAWRHKRYHDENLLLIPEQRKWSPRWIWPTTGHQPRMRLSCLDSTFRHDRTPRRNGRRTGRKSTGRSKNWRVRTALPADEDAFAVLVRSYLTQDLCHVCSITPDQLTRD